MKYRTDFVTNSSSSSFVIAIKDIESITDKNILYLKQLQEILIEKLVNKEEDTWYGSYEGTLISSIKELNEYFKETYFWKEKSMDEYFHNFPEREEDYNKMKNCLENHYVLIFREINYSDEFMMNLIKKLNDNENFIVLED